MTLMDETTRREIDKIVKRTLRDAGLVEPPVQVSVLIEHLNLYREFYDLEDPSVLQRVRHKVQVHGRKLLEITKKITLQAVWLTDDRRILIDQSLPAPKQSWASYHEVSHSLLPWHRDFFLGDTAQTLDPYYQEALEAEANYGASGLMFCGERFRSEALDLRPEWESVALLKKRYSASFPTTLRRFVEHSHDLSMAMAVISPPWEPLPDNQVSPCRHFVSSPRFLAEFGQVDAQPIVEHIQENVDKRRGGPVGEFDVSILNRNGTPSTFLIECFYNRYDILALLVCTGSPSKTIIVPSGSSPF
jgi:Zn-dependent peptidase ImmA (M78 family)